MQRVKLMNGNCNVSKLGGSWLADKGERYKKV